MTRGALFAGVNLIGDMLATTPAVREWKQNYPEDQIWYAVQDEPIIKALFKNPYIDRVVRADPDKVRSMKGWGNFTKKHLFDVNKAFNLGIRNGMHMAQAYGLLAGVSVSSCRPVLRLVDSDRANAMPRIPGEKFIVICPHSVSSSIENDDRGGNKLWGDGKWREILPILLEMGYVVVSIGGPRDPRLEIEGLTEIHDLPIRLSAAVMERAAYVITIDSGLAHIAAALDKNIVEIYPKTLPLTWVRPHVSHCRLIQGYPPQISVKSVVNALEELIGEVERGEKPVLDKESIVKKHPELKGQVIHPKALDALLIADERDADLGKDDEPEEEMSLTDDESDPEESDQ